MVGLLLGQLQSIEMLKISMAVGSSCWYKYTRTAGSARRRVLVTDL